MWTANSIKFGTGDQCSGTKDPRLVGCDNSIRSEWRRLVEIQQIWDCSCKLISKLSTLLGNVLRQLFQALRLKSALTILGVRQLSRITIGLCSKYSNITGANLPTYLNRDSMLGMLSVFWTANQIESWSAKLNPNCRTSTISYLKINVILLLRWCKYCRLNLTCL